MAVFTHVSGRREHCNCHVLELDRPGFGSGVEPRQMLGTQ